MIYVGSSSGVLEFDGATWRRIETPDAEYRALPGHRRRRPHLRRHVGDFGYLAPDAKGELQFVSLHERLPADARQFTDVWRTFATSDGVVFQTEQAIFRWAKDAFESFSPPSRFNRASLVDGRLYLTHAGVAGSTSSRARRSASLPGTEALGSEPYPVVLPLRRAPPAHRHPLQRACSSTTAPRSTPFPTESTRARRRVALPRPRAGRRHASRLTIDDRRPGHHRSAGPPACSCSTGRTACRRNVVYAPRWSTAKARSGRRSSAASPASSTPSPASFFDESDGFQRRVQLSPRHDGRLYHRVAGRRQLPARPRRRPSRRAIVPVPGVRQPVLVVRRDARSRRPAPPGAAGCVHRRAVSRFAAPAPLPIHAPADGTFRAALAAGFGRGPDPALGRAVRWSGVVPLARRSVD